MTHREMMLGVANQKMLGTYTNITAKDFQKMIRAEAGAEPDGIARAIVNGVLRGVLRRQGQVVCVTCGRVGPWSSGITGMHTGHFLASRRNSILFEEDNVACQCHACNYGRGGAPEQFRQWMEAVRGQETIERLERLKQTTRKFTREELVDLRIEYLRRLREALEKMRG